MPTRDPLSGGSVDLSLFIRRKFGTGKVTPINSSILNEYLMNNLQRL